VARFGGEEFALLLPSTDENGVQTVCEKVRTATEAMRIPIPGNDGSGQTIRITVSGGAVIVPHIGENGIEMAHVAAGLLEMADRCLYNAKESGRNRIVTQISTDHEAAAIGAEVPPRPVTAPSEEDEVGVE
jgi:two-component system chemotaxis family response regulator WspR